MSEIKNLHFELLGTFTCEGVAPKAGRKALSFLQYMVVHHERNISAEELIEEFWPERSNAPANALRRILSRVRAILKEIYPGQEDLLLTLPGCYAWNPEVSLELDTKRYEDACLEAAGKKENEKRESLLTAVSLYRGDFLSGNDSEWAAAPRQYYRALYLDACKALLPLLERKEQWREMLGICEQAYRIDFALEELTVYQMRAFIALGQPEQAVKKYGLFRGRMLEEFQTEPSRYVEQTYTLAAGLCKKENGISNIFEILKEEDREGRAFFCTFEMFRHVVALERRHLCRSRGNSTLVVVRIDRKNFSVTDIRRLERILLEELRAGDPVARLEAGAYILMLPGADEKKTQLVMSRLDRSFHKTYRRSRACMTYHIALLPFEKDKNRDPDFEKSNSSVTGDCYSEFRQGRG